jgi:hypothetical protein
MSEDLDEILNDMPKRGSRSKLENYASLIEELLRRGRTFREIASILRERCCLHASLSTLHFFVQRRATLIGKHKRSLINLRSGGRGDQELARPPAHPGTQEPAEQGVQERIAALRRRHVPAEMTPRPFQYDPSEPLRVFYGDSKNESVRSEKSVPRVEQADIADTD